MVRFCVAAFVAALLTIPAFEASAQRRTNVGALACDMAPTIGLIVGSRQKISCTFTPNGGGPVESYTGAINRLGLDLGVTAGGKMIWGVFSRTSAIPPRSIAGTYVGASGDASLGLGVGANVLVGGSRKSISLQPLSVEGTAGINLALGVAGMKLN
jgi:Protein of unknown function (DUF992)